ncbi:hypothetical protein ACEWY4_005447 [Coilia grayii]|uniref:Ig-like domain-containing protein n=1 Tax=Coilia grayii TaxID=363190 RepID=A0ABD1KIL3_9TELE
MICKIAFQMAFMITFSGLEALVLTQEKTLTSTLGTNVQIKCTKDSGSWAISWYQQKPGTAPKFLLTDSTRATGLASRFSYTDNGYDEYLNINGVTADDEAVYYCACHNCPTSSHHHSAPSS